MSAKHEPTLYSIPGQQGQDIAHIYWRGLLIWIALAIIGWCAVTWVTAWRFSFDPVLGQPLYTLGGFDLHSPLSLFAWIWTYFRPDVSVHTREIITQAIVMLAASGALSFFVAIAYIFRRTKKLRDQANHLHGSAGWASAAEIAALRLLPDQSNSGGVMVGSIMTPARVPPAFAQKLSWWPRWLGTKTLRQVYLRHKGPEHILVFAPTRSGKGVGIVVPTLLSWEESVLVHDVKGENWALTSGFRERVLKQRCLKFAPSELQSARFNPLSEIRRNGNIVKDVQNIATMIVDPDGKGMSDHWAKTGFDLLTGVILYVLLEQQLSSGERSLSTVQAILSDGGVIREAAEAAAQNTADDEASTGVKAVFEYIRSRAHEMLQAGNLQQWQAVGWQTAAQAAQSYLNKAPNEASGVMSTALSFLALYRDPIVADNTSVSDFSIESLMTQKTALYLVVPPSDKDRLKPLLRLILNLVVRRLTETLEFDATGASKTKHAHRLLLLIDEFPALGKLEVFEEALAFIAGYGIKAVLITQDLSQLHKAYSRDESIISNCHLRIAFAPNKIETAELLSKMTGQATVSQEQRSFSGTRLSVLLNNVSTSTQVVQRALLTPDETMRLPDTDALIFVAGSKPIYSKKIRYYEDPMLSKRQRLGAAKSFN